MEADGLKQPLHPYDSTRGPWTAGSGIRWELIMESRSPTQWGWTRSYTATRPPGAVDVTDQGPRLENQSSRTNRGVQLPEYPPGAFSCGDTGGH